MCNVPEPADAAEGLAGSVVNDSAAQQEAALLAAAAAAAAAKKATAASAAAARKAKREKILEARRKAEKAKKKRLAEKKAEIERLRLREQRERDEAGSQVRDICKPDTWTSMVKENQLLMDLSHFNYFKMSLASQGVTVRAAQPRP